MNESEATRAVEQAQALRQALEEDDRAIRQFLSSATLVQSAYTQALARVTQSFQELGRSLSGVATAGMNLISSLLNAVQPAAQALSGLATRLFGVTVWQSGSKAIEGTASALNKVSKATRSVAQAQRQLYSFDEITRVQSSGSSGSSSSSSGGGGGSSGSSAETGEWLRIPGLIDRWAAQAKVILGQIWQPFQAAWESQGEAVIEAAQFGLSEIGKTAAAIGASWLEIWTDGTGEQMVSTVLEIVERICQVAGELAARFREAWTNGETGKSIFQSIFAIVQNVLNAIRDMASATVVWAKQLNFTGLVSGFASLLAAIKPLSNLLAQGLYWGYVNVLLPLGSWVIQTAGPAMLNVLTSAINLLTAAFNLLKPVGTAVWEYLLKPMGSWTGSILVAGLNTVSQCFQNLTLVLNALPSTWESLKSKAATIWESIRTTITGAAQGIKSSTVSAFQSLNTSASSESTTLKSKIASTFSTVASSVKSKLSGIATAMTTPFRNGFNSVVTLLNKLITKINSALKFSWSAIKILGQTIVPAGSVTLAKLPTISKLAQGGITQGATLSLIGEAGREAVLPLDRNTDWMDRLADRLAQVVSGGETRLEVYVGGKLLTEQVIREVNALTRQSGRCPIYV